MTAPDSSTTFSLAPGEKPLGIQHPFLPSLPLGQSLLQPMFMKPLGSRSLTVLEPTVFRPTEQSIAVDLQSPLQESPFFDAPEPSATNPSIAPPTLQLRSLNSTNSVSEPPTAIPEAHVDSLSAFNTARSVGSIAPPIAAAPTPELTAPAVEPRTSADVVMSATSFADEDLDPKRSEPLNAPPIAAPSTLELTAPAVQRSSTPVDTFVSATSFADEASAPLGSRSARDGADVIETTASSDAATNPAAVDHEAKQPIGSTRSSSEPVASPTPTTEPVLQRRSDSNQFSVEPKILPPPIASTQADDSIALASAEVVPFADAISERPLPESVSEPVSVDDEAAVSLPPAVNERTENAVTSALPASTSTTLTATPALPSPLPVTEASAPAIARLALENPVTEPVAQSSSEPSVPAIQLSPDVLPVETTAPSEAARSQSNSEALTPDVSVPETSTPAIAPVVSEPSTASDTQTVPDLTPLDSTPLDPTPSIATEPNATPSALPAIALFPLADATALEDTTEPTRSDSVVQRSPAEPTVIPAIAPFSAPEAPPSERPLPREVPTRSDSVVQRSPEPTVIPAIAPFSAPEAPPSERPLPEAAFPDSLAMPFNRQEPDSNPPSDGSLNATPVETNLFSVPELPTANSVQAKREPDDRQEPDSNPPSDSSLNATPVETNLFSVPELPTANIVQAKREPDETVERMVGHPVDRVNEVSEVDQMKLAADATSDDSSEVVQRSPNHEATEKQTAEFRAPESIVQKLDNEPLEATATEPTVAMQSDRRVEPAVEPSITTQTEAQTNQPYSESKAPLFERAQFNEPSIAANVDLSRSSLEPLATSALDSEVLASDSSSQADTPIPSVQLDGIEAGTPPLIQPKADISAASAIVPQPTISDVTSAAVQNDNSETSPLPATEPGLNIPALNLPISPMQTSGMAMEAVQRKPAALDAIALDPVADVPETVSPEAVLPETIASNQFSALPELPTAIQRLSVWEPLIQLQPLIASVAPPAVQPVQTARYPDVATSPSQTVDRAADQLSTPGLDRFNPVSPSNVSSFNDVVSLKTEAAPAEWSSIAELFQSTNTPQFNAPNSGATQPDATLTNGYTDLNLRAENNTALPDVIQRKPDALSAIAVPATPAPSAEPTGGQLSPPAQPQTPQASPDQLERLAQEIYKLVRQRLAVERERGGNLYPRRSI